MHCWHVRLGMGKAPPHTSGASTLTPHCFSDISNASFHAKSGNRVLFYELLSICETGLLNTILLGFLRTPPQKSVLVNAFSKVVSHSVMQTVGLGLILQGDKLDVGQFLWAGRLYAHCSRLDNFVTV